jgi:hypothetical protein
MPLPLGVGLCERFIWDLQVQPSIWDVDVNRVTFFDECDWPAAEASGDTWPIHAPRVAPLNLPPV